MLNVLAISREGDATKACKSAGGREVVLAPCKDSPPSWQSIDDCIRSTAGRRHLTADCRQLTTNRWRLMANFVPTKHRLRVKGLSSFPATNFGCMYHWMISLA